MVGHQPYALTSLVEEFCTSLYFAFSNNAVGALLLPPFILESTDLHGLAFTTELYCLFDPLNKLEAFEDLLATFELGVAYYMEVSEAFAEGFYLEVAYLAEASADAVVSEALESFSVFFDATFGEARAYFLFFYLDVRDFFASLHYSSSS
jgi:hypothetical protein